MTDEKIVPRCFMCGNVERDGVALVHPAERPDLWYDGCHAGYVELLRKVVTKLFTGRCQWCSGGWLQDYGVYECNCETRCGCPQCSVEMPDPTSESGEFVVVALIETHLWDNGPAQADIMADLEHTATEEATTLGLHAALPGEITLIHPAGSPEGRTHPDIGPDQVLVSLKVGLVPQAQP